MGDLLGRSAPADGRYLIDKEIARGGMGAVLRGIDRDIRREVAVKFMLDERDARKKARFVEEAQITGQLEHPNIVPVHELGIDAEKRPFFTMKMVRGRSLAQILETLSQDPKQERRQDAESGVAQVEALVDEGRQRLPHLAVYAYEDASHAVVRRMRLALAEGAIEPPAP